MIGYYASFYPGCGKKEYIETNDGKGRTWAICGCANGWLCDACKKLQDQIKEENKNEI